MYFTDAHEALRLHIRKFLEKEVQPHLEEWGEQIAAIAITEPDAGSDVAGITTVARRFGDEFIVNGRKTFITNGARCHWALVVTKGERERGHSGYNLLVIEKGTPGFEVSRTLKKLGMHSSDTAELLFE